MWPLCVLFGGFVGFSLGLTGGGGAIFAVPLLVYGLGVDPREAVGISLASVGVTSFLGFVGRWRTRQVELRTGLVFAAAGMLSAPFGSWVSGRIPEAALLTLFAFLMLIVALLMWSKAPEMAGAELPAACSNQVANVHGPVCRRDINGNLLLTSRCMWLLAAVGLVTGILSGLFGVGGGFVIVPALVLFSGMAIHHAVGTSLMVIVLVSISGIASHLLAGRTISIETTSLFVVGGVVGMLLGNLAGRRLSGPSLQKVFAVAIVAVAIFLIVRSLFTVKGRQMSMGHTLQIAVGMSTDDLDQRIQKYFPGHMPMGRPANMPPMGGIEGPFGEIDAGDMFLVLKVRKDIDSCEELGCDKRPPGSVAGPAIEVK